nr:acetylcholine receptor subunit alpha-type acr-16-like [Ciona intestinalis]|eukprot:XP_026689443.1 acetylcholine receptor subunit alpha-type acr-16-like [Ciona intestinalis]
MFSFILKTFLVALFCRSTLAGKGGKAATKVGLAGISQVGASAERYTDESQDNVGEDYGVLQGGKPDFGANLEKKLKYDLFVVKRYDRNIRPVNNATEQVLIQIDLSYVQVLNLNEKDQILKSLLRLRIYWKDDYLRWDPLEYGNLTSLWLPATTVWFPDIVVYEEIGSATYAPRVPYVFVRSDGTVGFLQPTAYETTCSINIAFFPFDRQVCTMKFTSWTFPTSKVDLMTRRSSKQIKADIPTYFVSSGEWTLEDITVNKQSQSYVDVVSETDAEHDDHDDDHDDDVRYLDIDPLTSVRDVAPDRMTSLHWSDISFSFYFTRNSGLYMQSMLFPAILLTTISLLGFYLPPDSGERIGLQITIMLTFMVFLLTVGDMFPASTGPYLGVYFVLCMALLGINIIMTVLVLHIHHMPCDAVMEETQTKGVYKVNFQKIPYWVKFCLFCAGQYMELKNYTLTEDDVEVPRLNKTAMEFVKHLLKKWKANVLKKQLTKSVSPLQNLPDPELGRNKKGAINEEQDYMSVGQGNNPWKKFSKKQGFADIAKGPMSTTTNILHKLMNDMVNKMGNVCDNVLQLSNYMRYRNLNMKENRLEAAMNEKWKSVARLVDQMCLRVYIFMLVVFHLAILFAILIEIYL